MSDWRDRIVTNADIPAGKPTVKSTRSSAELILGPLGSGRSIEEILDQYPHLTREDVLAALSFAVDFMRNERFVITQPEDAAAE
jgi:uncharacterized protein (DUF433 family)